MIQDSDDESDAGASPPPTGADDLELSLSPIIDLQYSSPTSTKIMDASEDTSNVSTGIASLWPEPFHGTTLMNRDQSPVWLSQRQ